MKFWAHSSLEPPLKYNQQYNIFYHILHILLMRQNDVYMQQNENFDCEKKKKLNRHSYYARRRRLLLST